VKTAVVYNKAVIAPPRMMRQIFAPLRRRMPAMYKIQPLRKKFIKKIMSA
jgi:hypothetical protein